MKKSLLAVAAMSAFAGAAQAQSSVTVYGVLDVGFVAETMKNSGITGANSGPLPAQPNTYQQATTNASGFGHSAEQTSRLGFKGVEDLGGGTSAFFTIETNLTPSNVGTMSSMNNRQSFVGLKKNGLGAASIGTQYTPIHEAIAATDAGQQNNMPGNVVYTVTPSGGNFAGTPNLAPNEMLYANAQQGGPGPGNNNYTNRVGNSIKFVSDPFAGFVGKLIYAQNSSTTNSVTPNGVNNAQGNINTGGYNNFSGWGVGVDYTMQKLLVTADYQSFKSNTYAITTQGVNGQATTAMTLNATSSGLGASANNVSNQAYLAGTYDFGILKAYVQYINRKDLAVTDNNVYAQRTGQQIGVRSFVTPTIEPWASIGSGKVTNSYYVTPTNASNIATTSVAANVFGWQLGSNYWLSKRTNLYAIYGRQSTGNAVYPTTQAGNVANINSVSSSYSSYALGMRHTF
jgi:predicted porin